MRKDEVDIIGVANISDLAYSIRCEKKAKSLILEIDKAQEDVGFTKDLIVSLIKEMKKEYKSDKDSMGIFRAMIHSALR